MDNIMYWIETEGNGHCFFVAFPVSLLILLILLKGRRLKFVVPSMVISLVIVNPVFYERWTSLGLYAYWRILWVVPVVTVVGAVIPTITERINSVRQKGIIAVAGIGLLVFIGSFIYNGIGGAFQFATNSAKLPEDIIEVTDRLLELQEYPKAVLQYPLGVYTRQYTGALDQLSGRDVNGYIIQPSKKNWNMVSKLNRQNWDVLSQLMADEDYDYLVYGTDVDSGFELVDRLGDWRIYAPIANPRIINERNELGQVVKSTIVDDKGDAVSGRDGIVSKVYEYDGLGYLHREYLSDNIKTVSGKELIMTGDPDVDGCVFIDGNGLYRKQEGGYYGYLEEKNSSGEVVSRLYCDQKGEGVQREDGYGKVCWTRDEGGRLIVSFYDLSGQQIEDTGLNLVNGIVTGDDGWSGWIIPERNNENVTFKVGTLSLGERDVGDLYSFQIEIEFKDVSVTEGAGFYFCTQGATDGKWNVRNIWNASFVRLDDPPEDGRYLYSCVKQLDEDMVNVSTFDIGFRCDNWRSGAFRVRSVKIEKGHAPTAWSPGL